VIIKFSINVTIKAQNLVAFYFLCFKSAPSKCQQNISSPNFGMFTVKHLKEMQSFWLDKWFENHGNVKKGAICK
jgi:hypothetical protein